MSTALPLAIAAFALGVRHAFDVDHIAAIDNVTRKLAGEGRRSLGTGLFFALGHSTVVFALCLLVGLGVHGLGDAVRDDGSALRQATALIGPLVSGVFLLLIGGFNLLVLRDAIAAVRRLRRGEGGASGPAATMPPGGPMNRVFGRAMRAVREPWQMYPVGFLFGLGFDTATEVALLALAGSAGAARLPLYAILAPPLLFAAGMTLFDTLDGIAMAFAYGWSGRRPARRAAYNLALTGVSVALALSVGALQLFSAASLA